MAKVTGPGSYRLQTLEGEGINNSWNVDQLCRFYAQSTRLLRGSSLHDYSGVQVYTTTSRPLRRKQPPGPGTSLRTTPLQDPARAATYGSWAATSDKGL
jgi:hypothetical protein